MKQILHHDLTRTLGPVILAVTFRLSQAWIEDQEWPDIPMSFQADQINHPEM